MTVLRYLGYVAFFLVSLVLSLYVTFPWDAARDRVLDMASKRTGMTITAKSLEPSLLTGVVAKELKVTPQGARDPITLDEVELHAKIFAFLTGKTGFSFEVPIAKGEVTGDVVIGGDTLTIKGETQNVELGLLPGINEATGLPLTGLTHVKADLVVGMKDPKLTTGAIALRLKGLKIEKGGKMSGFPVPELSVGDIDWQVPVEAGKATFKNLRVSGESIELILDGTIALLHPLGRSNANLVVSFKPTDKLLQSEPLLGALLNNIQRAKGGDGFYTYQMSGSLQSPRFFPRKK